MYLGAPEPVWLERPGPHPWMVSAARLRRVKRPYVAAAPWALDSGAFSELAAHGRWTVTAEQYAGEVARARSFGGLVFCGQQDWMCEPFMLAKTGLTVAEHQARTVANFVELRGLGVGEAIPTLQGWTVAEYERHADRFAAAGVDLASEPLVGLGSVCRRRDPEVLAGLVASWWAAGVKLHGFGVKARSARVLGGYLASTDSAAWSYNARRSGGDSNAASSAVAWARRNVGPVQLRLL
jgi:hypothetical protein